MDMTLKDHVISILDDQRAYANVPRKWKKHKDIQFAAYTSREPFNNIVLPMCDSPKMITAVVKTHPKMYIYATPRLRAMYDIAKYVIGTQEVIHLIPAELIMNDARIVQLIFDQIVKIINDNATRHNYYIRTRTKPLFAVVASYLSVDQIIVVLSANLHDHYVYLPYAMQINKKIVIEMCRADQYMNFPNLDGTKFVDDPSFVIRHKIYRYASERVKNLRHVIYMCAKRGEFISSCRLPECIKNDLRFVKMMSDN